MRRTYKAIEATSGTMSSCQRLRTGEKVLA
jgi:hypothetical protein